MTGAAFVAADASIPPKPGFTGLVTSTVVTFDEKVLGVAFLVAAAAGRITIPRIKLNRGTSNNAQRKSNKGGTRANIRELSYQIKWQETIFAPFLKQRGINSPHVPMRMK